ncbi:MAG: DUF4169 family protein [Pseudomonadota bacterium]
MADIINLRRERKQRTRRDKEKKSAENRAKFGTAKDDKMAIDLAEARRNRDLDGHQRQKSDDLSPSDE